MIAMAHEREPCPHVLAMWGSGFKRWRENLVVSVVDFRSLRAWRKS
jgi:hypothetical protein